jgi:hypothetical protein
MTHFKSVEFSDKSSFALVYENCTPKPMADLIHDSILMDGYSVHSGMLGNRTYVKGNRVARLLLGAFYKYFQFHVEMKEIDEGSVRVTVTKTTTGMSGGLVGVNQVKKELARLESVMKEL